MSGVERLSEERLRDWSDRALLEHILRRQEEQTMALQDLQDAVTALEQAEVAEQAELSALLSEAQGLHDQLAALQGQVTPDGTVAVPQAALDDLTARVATLLTNAQGAVQAAQAADPAAAGGGGGTPPAPDPNAPAPDPNVPAPGPAPVDTGGGTAPTPVDTGGGTAPAPAAAEDRTLYTFDGDPTSIDATVWQQAPFVTSEQPSAALYFFAGDTDSGQRNGDGVNGVWHAYDGTPVPTNETGAPVESAAEPDAGDGGTEPARPTGAEG